MLRIFLSFYPISLFVFFYLFFFFSSRRRHTIYWRDWSSYVCSSDLRHDLLRPHRQHEVDEPAVVVLRPRQALRADAGGGEAVRGAVVRQVAAGKEHRVQPRRLGLARRP